jgi:hypothetical protein
MEHKLKWLTSLSQKARKPEVDLTVPPRWSTALPGRQQVPNPAETSGAERGNPVSSPAREGEPQGDLMEVRAWDVGKSEGRSVMERIRVSTSPGTKVSPRPTGAFSRESMENTLNGKSKERWRWFDHPPVQPLLWPSQSLVPTMLVSRRLSREGQLGRSRDRPLRCLSRMRGNSHVRFLEGLGGRKAPWPTRRRQELCKSEC